MQAGREGWEGAVREEGGGQGGSDERWERSAGVHGEVCGRVEVEAGRRRADGSGAVDGWLPGTRSGRRPSNAGGLALVVVPVHVAGGRRG